MKLRIIGVACALLFAGTVSAQDSGFYAGAALGQSKVKFPIYLEFEDFTFEDTFESNQIAFKLLAGYQFNSFVSLEAAYVDLGKARQSFGGVNGRVDATAVQGSVILSYPVKPLFSPYIRGSVVAYDIAYTASFEEYWARSSGNEEDFSYGIGAMFTSRKEDIQLRLDLEQAKIDDFKTRMASFSVVYLFR